MTTWATEVESLDDLKQFSTVLGRVTPSDAGPVGVDLVQVEGAAPQVRVNGYRFSLGQAAELARLIRAANELAKSSDGGSK